MEIGQSLSFEVDGLDAGANSDAFVIGIGNAAGPRWGMDVHSLATHAGSDTSGYTLVAERTPEGMHVDFTLTGPDTYAASVRVLDGSDPVFLAGALDGAAGSAIDRLTFTVDPSFAHVDAFYANNLAVTPEPAGGLLGLVGVVTLAVRRRRRSAPRTPSML
jgi:MYXO-CTERM domain-containing protein